jgi:hypothetical protein
MAQAYHGGTWQGARLTDTIGNAGELKHTCRERVVESQFHTLSITGEHAPTARYRLGHDLAFTISDEEPAHGEEGCC